MNRYSDMRVGKITLHKVLFGLALSVLLFTLLLSLVGYLGKFHHYLELTSHFKLQYLSLSGISLILMLLANRKRWVFISLFCLALNSAEILPWYLPQWTILHTEQPLRVLVSNVLIANKSYEPLITLIRQEKPDIVVVMEITPAWVAQLASIQSILPYSFVKSAQFSSGIGLYSALPLQNPAIKYWAKEAPVPSIVADIRWQGKLVSLIATHPVPPVKSSFFRSRNQHLAAMGSYIASLKTPVIVLGDLNTTMWSPFYRTLIQKTGLVNSRQGFGIQPTFPVYAPLFRIPIDHCLVSPTISVLSNRVGNDIGSDHYPLLTDLSLDVTPERL